MSKKNVYRVIFMQNDTIYEIYAKHVSESEMFGFVVIEDLLFGEKSSVVVDPTEERLKALFFDVKKTFIPMQSVIRIDEVAKEGHAKISQAAKQSGNVSLFPPSFVPSHFDIDKK